jgi:hypothetical protein
LAAIGAIFGVMREKKRIFIDLQKNLGLRREYYQFHKVLNHYDLVPSKRKLAIFNGAVPIQIGEWLKRKKKGDRDVSEDVPTRRCFCADCKNLNGGDKK